ncbi:MAG: cyclic nucleotide-binding domain-containing protein [Actinomycetota bacterium]
MAEIHIFKNASDALPLEPGEALFRAGDQGDVMFAVVDGEIELSRAGSVIEIVGPGGILGELSLIDPAPRSADAHARGPARVVRIDQRQFTFLVHEHPTFALQVMAVMAERLRKTTDASIAHTS